MANIGEIAEVVFGSKLTLEVGSGNYIMLTDINWHVGRTEDRTPTTDAGALYNFGKGDSFFTGTLVLTTPEIDTAYTNATTAAGFHTLTAIDANGDMDPITWKLKALNRSGNAKTLTASGILRDYDMHKDVEGKAVIDIFVRITTEPEDITVT